jgi:hypothetical protein
MTGLGLGAATMVIGARREAFLASLLERPAKEAQKTNEYRRGWDGPLLSDSRESSQTGFTHTI